MSPRFVRLRLLGLMAPLGLALAIGLGSHGRAQAATPAPLDVRSPAFADGQPIPARYTCDGEGASPPLEWGAVPDGTRSIALIVTDPDAPRGPFTHWLVYDLPPAARELPAGSGTKGALPAAAALGLNSRLEPGWTSVCPPSGQHRYVFRVLALDRRLAPTLRSPTARDLEQAAAGHVLAEGQLTGVYARHGR